MSKIREFFCRTNNNNRFELEILENSDDRSICGKLTRIENDLPLERIGSNPILYRTPHDLGEIVGSNLDQIVANAKERIQKLGFKILRWEEKEIDKKPPIIKSRDEKETSVTKSDDIQESEPYDLKPIFVRDKEFKCFNCRSQVTVNDNFCNNCGQKVLKQFSSQTFFETYCVMDEKKLSNLAKKYKENLFPAPLLIELADPIDHVSRICFGIGYNLRRTELCFNHIFKKDLSLIIHNDKTLGILNSKVAEEEKVAKIAEYKEMNNEMISIGSEIEEYSVLGLNTSKACMTSIISHYLDADQGKIGKLDITHSELKEFAYRAAALGYCFKLAEEIVLVKAV